MNKRISINLIGQLISFVCLLGINFFMTPFVVENLGAEAYGFVGLANSFTGYISLITIALTSMLSRYVTVEYSRNNIEKASEYLSTAVISQLVLALILLVPMLILTNNIDHVVDISSSITSDVKLLWLLIFITFLAGLPTGCFNVASFAKNRLDLQAIIGIASNLIRAITLLIAFLYFPPKVWYVGLATITAGIVTIIGNYFLKIRLLPEVKIACSKFRKQRVSDLLMLGIWSSLSRLGTMFITGLDLLLTNIFINSVQMGLLSIAKSLPAQLGNLAGSVMNAFEPDITINYAKNSKANFLGSVTSAMKMNGLICSIPLLGVACFGESFYSLWMPSLGQNEISEIQILAVLTMLPQILEVYVQPLYSVNTVTKNVRLPVFIQIAIGVVNVGIVLILLQHTTLGVFAVAGVSSVLCVLKIVIFMPIYAAWCVGEKWFYFYGVLGKGLLNTCIIAAVFSLINIYFNIDSWKDLIVIAISSGAIGYVISFIVLMSKNDRAYLLKKLKIKKS